MFSSQGSERFVLEVRSGKGQKQNQIGSCAGLHVPISTYQLLYAILTSFLVSVSSLAPRSSTGVPFIHIKVRLLSFFPAADGYHSLTFAL